MSKNNEKRAAQRYSGAGPDTRPSSKSKAAYSGAPETGFGNRQHGTGKSSPRKGSQTRSHGGRKHHDRLRIIPLGGLDAIGKNMTAFWCGRDMILVDAGLMFPDDDQFGIDLILPDYTYVLEHADELRGIIVTHGHEDHTGALPYLLKDLDRPVPIFGSRMTLGLIEGKLAEHDIRSPRFQEVDTEHALNLGCFSINCFNVNHSIPGALGLYIRTPAGSVLHTGDFKLDQTPIDGVRFDYDALSRYAHQGVDLLMSDSTNAGKSEFTKSEAEVGKVLTEIIANASRRVIVAAFSSHIHRIQQVCDAAAAAKRKVAVTGRSMLTNTRIARELGYLDVPDNLIVDAYEAKDIPPHKLVVLCTGSQGEPLSALARMSNGEHRTIDIEAGDTVIISASPVPGNEKAVTRVINSLSKIGADVYDKSRALVHVSGHAGAEELKLILAMVHPKYFMPVHGEAVHLRTHAKLARAVGIPEKNIFVIDNGDSLVMDDHKVTRGEAVESGVVYVDGISVGDTNQVVLRDRKVLANDGVATVVILLNPKTGKPVGDVELIMRGVTGGDEKLLFDDAHACVKQALEKAAGSHGARPNVIQREVREALSKLLWERCHRRPMIIPIVMEI
ncbi:MAG: ribonuclease J [Coriobacteriales bacterium]